MTRDEFIAENIGLVHACARRFSGRGIEYDDLYQAGCMGLVKAVDHFEPERGLCFSTYAVPVILGEIRRLFRDGGAVKVSRGLKELSVKAARCSSEFTAQNGRPPRVSELSELLGVSEEEAAMALGAGQPPVSLTESEEEGGGQKSVVVEAPEESITDRLALHQAVASLEQQDRALITARYFQHKTQNQTAAELGMTQVQVSRREKKILQMLRGLLL